MVPKSVDEFEAWMSTHAIDHHKIGVFDIDGVFRGKYVDRDKCLAAVDQGFGFCDVVLGWDSADALYDQTKVSGWHTGYRDAPVRLDLSTLRTIPFEPKTSLLIGQFEGDYANVCPRTQLYHVLQRLRAAGYEARVGFEYEFFVFDETPHSARAKGYRDLTPWTPGMFGYSVLRNSTHFEVHHELLEIMKGLDCPLEGLHTETGPGVLEAAIRYDEASRAADKAALFKTFTKVIMQRRGLMATFMAKWSNDLPGQSGHIHLSLWKAGQPAFWDEQAPDHMSTTMRQFMAGQLHTMGDLLPMTCSTVNAYRRLVPGLWAPTHVNWGHDNRTTALRAISPTPHTTRIEVRLAPADANPYLALTAALAGGLYGLEHGLELPDPVVGNGYENPGGMALPRTLSAATRGFRESSIAREMLGEAFVDHFATTREWEVRAHDRHVSDWDLARYFEII